MSIYLCQNCKRKLRASDHAIQKKRACPNCGHVHVVPLNVLGVWDDELVDGTINHDQTVAAANKMDTLDVEKTVQVSALEKMAKPVVAKPVVKARQYPERNIVYSNNIKKNYHISYYVIGGIIGIIFGIGIVLSARENERKRLSEQPDNLNQIFGRDVVPKEKRQKAFKNSDIKRSPIVNVKRSPIVNKKKIPERSRRITIRYVDQTIAAQQMVSPFQSFGSNRWDHWVRQNNKILLFELMVCHDCGGVEYLSEFPSSEGKWVRPIHGIRNEVSKYKGIGIKEWPGSLTIKMGERGELWRKHLCQDCKKKATTRRRTNKS